MKVEMLHTLDPELTETIRKTREETKADLDELLDDFVEKVRHAWMISLIGTGVLTFGLGFTIGKLTK